MFKIYEPSVITRTKKKTCRALKLKARRHCWEKIRAKEMERYPAFLDQKIPDCEKGQN